MDHPVKPIDFACPHCGVILSVPGTLAGQEGKCGECRRTFRIPGGQSPDPAPRESELPDTWKLAWVAAGILGAIPLFAVLRRAVSDAKSLGCVMMLLGAWVLLLISAELWMRRRQALRQTALPDGTVADVLERLPGAIVLRDLTGDAGDIPFAVIMPREGLFIIHVVEEEGIVTSDGADLMVNGRPDSSGHVDRAVRNAVWFGAQVRGLVGDEVWVHPLVVFHRGSVDVKDPIRGVRAVGRSRLAEVILETRGTRTSRRTWKHMRRHGTTL
jgi:hypothetical protein